MLESHYLEILLVCGIIITFIGGYLCLSTVPQKETFKDYRRSRIIIGFTIMVWGFEYILLSKTNFRTQAPFMATAINISMYYAGALLFGAGIISLIKKDYINKKQIITDIIKYISVLSLIWSGALFFQGKARNLTLILSAAIFGMDAIRLSVIFFKNYNKTLKNLDNYYSENTANFVKWINKCVSSIVVMGILGSILAFAPKWVISIYAIGGLLVFIFTFNCLQNYLIGYEKINPVFEEDIQIEEQENINRDIIKSNPCIFDDMGQILTKWVNEGSFLQGGITIQQLSVEIGTNRTYLSEYINKEFGMTFREWITDLRIEESKKLLIENKSATMIEIAEKTGYATSSHFIRTFTNKEGISPSKWRETINVE